MTYTCLTAPRQIKADGGTTPVTLAISMDYIVPDGTQRVNRHLLMVSSGIHSRNQNSTA